MADNAARPTCETCLMPLDDHIGGGFAGCLRALGIATTSIQRTLGAVGAALLAAAAGFGDDELERLFEGGEVE